MFGLRPKLPAEDPDSDQALLARFRGGEPDAFAQIVARYSGLVYACCHRVTGDAQRAEDLSQETFFKLSRHSEEVTHSLPAWLHRVATRGSIDALRRTGARRRYERAAGQEHARVADERVGDDRAEVTWAELGPEVDEALAALPDEAVDAITRHYLSGQAQRTIAEALGVSQATVSRRIARGLDQLRAQLRGRGLAVGSAAALGAVLAGAPAHAAPGSLAQAAGKMSLVHSAAAGKPVLWMGLTAGKAVAAGAGAVACVAVAVVAVRWAGNGLQPSAAPIAAPAISPPRAATGGDEANDVHDAGGDDAAAREMVYLPLDGAAGFATTHLIGIELPTGDPDATLQAVYADGHVATITEREAARHVQAQTGLTMEQLLREAPRTPLVDY